MIASLIYQCVPDPCDLQRSLERNRSVTHTTGRCDGRQEGCERGYYNLHRNLNNPLFHKLFRLNVSCRRSDTWGLARSVLFPMAHWCLSPVCHLYGLILIQAFSAIAAFTADTRADHEGRSLSGHSEATSVDTVVLSQLEG